MARKKTAPPPPPPPPPTTTTTGDATPPLPEQLPVLPLRDVVVYPLAVVPLLVGQERSVRLIDDVMQRDRLMVLVTQREDVDNPGPEQLFRIGTVGIIHQMMRSPDRTLRLVVQGLSRVRLGEFTAVEPYLAARLSAAPESASVGTEAEGLRRAVVDLFRRFVALTKDLPNELAAITEGLDDPRQVAYLVAATVPLDSATRQGILEIDAVDDKLRVLVELLQKEVAVRELGQKITTETEARLGKAQREYYLREQIRSIQRELGEAEDESPAAELRKKLEAAALPAEARKEADRELTRLGAIPAASPEHGIIRTYLDWMAALPWGKLTGGNIDIGRARQVLDEDHYDLERIKERILEHLAVKKLRLEREPRPRPDAEPGAGAGDAPGAAVAPPGLPGLPPREPILCLVGPPGVGKTSLGQSIARALGRAFVRLALGGVHDEAEVRGHRRTYIGAMPGRILQELKRAGARDPVFMLDEIDKVGADWRGDPASALLEVLDPAQNSTFVDNYLNVPFDLSQVFFLTTANTLDTIPPPLRDRMEILTLAGYTEQEKRHIARRYLIPRQIAASGLTADEIVFEDAALARVIADYTREAGVRSLEREIAAICRKLARSVAEGRSGSPTITGQRVGELLGPPRFVAEVAERTDRPGVATGLAWTPAGGDVLFVEATMMPSREERLILTGMLGDVMRESAQAALSYLRANAGSLGIDARRFEGSTVHLHVPAGAIPKDGPSAGVTMLTALASLASGRAVRGDLAMTGEITLRGKVLPVGGIKEKVLAAHRAGIRQLILPRRNQRDLEELPEETAAELTVILVDTAEEVLAHALEPAPGPRPRHRRR